MSSWYRQRTWWKLLAWSLMASYAAQTSAVAQTPAAPQSVMQRLQTRVRDWQGELPALGRSATQTATRVIAGGKLYLAGPQKSFTLELLGRSGGLMLVKSYNPKLALTDQDTILAASSGSVQDDEAPLAEIMATAKTAGAKVILFSNAAAQKTLPSATGAEQVFPSRAFQETVPARSSLSIESNSNVMGAWAWMGEFISACMAQGKMPTVFESIGVPGGRERDDILRPQAFHAVTTVTPAAARGLGARYLQGLATTLEQVWTRNSSELARAATLVQEAHKAGGVVKTYYLGHMFPSEMQVPQNPDWFTLGTVVLPPPLPAPKPGSDATPVVPEVPRAQDVYFVLGYQAFPWALISSMPDNGQAWIVTSAHRPLPEFTTNPRHIFLDPIWQAQDAGLKLDGYDVDILPFSGVVQTGLYWQLVEFGTTQ